MSRHTVFFKRVGLLVALWLMATTTHAEIYYLHNDHLGNPQAVTDENRNIVWQGEYSPFGELVSETGTLKQPHRFPGQHADPETGLYYNYFRDYDPSLGRYVQSDPIGLRGGINTYGYVYQNPMRYTDPEGLFVPLACAANPICAAAVAQAARKTAQMCVEAAGIALTGLWGAWNENSNPYDGPVDEPVIVVDSNGNAIPVDEGQQINSSPNGDYQQVVDADGKPTGDRLDRGGHKNQKDPAARGPHAHRPGVTTPDGNPHLPIY